MNFPEELKYSSGHEWVRLEGDFALIGITDYAQHGLGRLDNVVILSSNRYLKGGEVFGSLESNKTVSDIIIPVDGQIIERNEHLDNTPEYVNYHPYDKGWLIRIKILERNQIQALLDAFEYRTLIGA